MYSEGHVRNLNALQGINLRLIETFYCRASEGKDKLTYDGASFEEVVFGICVKMKRNGQGNGPARMINIAHKNIVLEGEIQTNRHPDIATT